MDTEQITADLNRRFVESFPEFYSGRMDLTAEMLMRINLSYSSSCLASPA